MKNAPARKVLLPVLSRSTDWTPERIAALSAAEVRNLSANAARMEEAEVVALCTQDLSQRSKRAGTAAKPAKKPAAKAKPQVKAAA